MFYQEKTILNPRTMVPGEWK